jgi:hypothetical protein
MGTLIQKILFIGLIVSGQLAVAATSTNVSVPLVQDANIKQYCCYPQPVTLTDPNPAFQNLNKTDSYYGTVDCSIAQSPSESPLPHAAMPAAVINAVFAMNPGDSGAANGRLDVGVRCKIIKPNQKCEWLSAADCAALSSPS